MGARPVAIGAEAHDAAVAFTSHLPQIVAVALAQLLGERLDNPAVAALCGPGMASMTRLGRSPWTMWRSLLLAGGPAAAQEVGMLSDVLADVARELETGAAGALEQRSAAAGAASQLLAAGRAGENDRPPPSVTVPPMNEAT